MNGEQFDSFSNRILSLRFKTVVAIQLALIFRMNQKLLVHRIIDDGTIQTQHSRRFIFGEPSSTNRSIGLNIGTTTLPVRWPQFNYRRSRKFEFGRFMTIHANILFGFNTIDVIMYDLLHGSRALFPLSEIQISRQRCVGKSVLFRYPRRARNLFAWSSSTFNRHFQTERLKFLKSRLRL